MSYFLLPAQTVSHGLRPRNTYGTILTDVVRASADSIDALELFRELLRGDGTNPQSVGFTAFDAHVGDTSCQLRAGMLLDLVKHYKKHGDTTIVLWLDKALKQLQDLRTEAREMLRKLTVERIHPSKLGIGARHDTPEAILRVLGWSEPDFPVHAEENCTGQSSGTENERQIAIRSRPVSHSDPYKLLDMAAARLKHETQHMFGPTIHPWEAPEHHEAAEPVRAPSVRRPTATSPLLSEGGMSTAWDLDDSRIVIRFLVYCFVLSKYKSFRRFKHVVGARLYPEAAVRYGDELVKDVLDRSTPDYKHSKATRRVDLEFAALQTWVSELSCAWLQSISMRSNRGAPVQRMITETIRTSEKNLSSVPAYSGYLLLREMWSRDNDSIILVDRRFCSKGFHSNFFMATLKLEEGKQDSKPANCAPLDHHVGWKIEPVTAEWLVKHHDQRTPHIVIMGNSIDGTYEDYMAASSPDAITGYKHNCADCEDNEMHMNRFKNHDHDRLALCFFARHKHYTFDLPDPEEDKRGEGEVVAEIMRRNVPRLDEHWKASNDEAEDVGTGNALWMFSWQHAFLETKGRIATMVSNNRTTVPISITVE